MVETATMKTMPVQDENIVQLPLGLLGFERIKKYVLLTSPDEAPFEWLQVLDDPTLAFLVLPALDVIPGYAPDIAPDDSEFLGIESPADVLLYCIVTLHQDGSATINLKGPLVLNRHTLCGKQVILANAADYDIDHPLPVHETQSPCTPC